MGDLNICKCGNEKCLGFLLLHEKELEEIEQRKDSIRKKYGQVEFNLKRSPSSGEIFTKFYELHVSNNN
ncbi:UNVERIFIED_ORG: hypothetical protein B2H93_04600 [Clostridium botulinum]